MTNYCKGCHTYMHQNGCSFMYYNKDGECPCVTCIIKPMCNKPCPNFKEFRKDKGEPDD